MSAAVAMLHPEMTPLSTAALTWAQAQGFEQYAELADAFQISEASDVPGALRVPFLDGGKPVGWQFRRYADDRCTFPPVRTVGDCDRLYNADVLNDATLKDEPLVVADSLLACWAFRDSGFPRVVAIPYHTPIGARRWNCIEATRELWQGARIVLAIHDDESGATVREDLAAQFGRARCQWLAWPKGCRSAEQTFRQYGARGLQASVERAQFLAVPDIYRLSELPEPPLNPAIDIGIIGLAEHYRVRRGDFCVVSSMPGVGKTTLVNEIVCRLGERHKWRAVFASFEQRPKPDHRRALRTLRIGKLERDMSTDEKAAADAWIEDYCLFLKPADDVDTDLNWLLDRLEMAVERINASVVVVDPWNELDHIRPAGVSVTEYTGWAIRQLKRFAQRHRVHLIVVAHPAKMQRDRNGEYPRPTLYDIADSAHWFNKPDVGVMLYRRTGDNETEIMVVKTRYREIGRPGSIKGIWNEATGRYTITNDGTMSGAT